MVETKGFNFDKGRKLGQVEMKTLMSFLMLPNISLQAVCQKGYNPLVGAPASRRVK